MALRPEAVGLLESRDRAGARNIGGQREYAVLPSETESSERLASSEYWRVLVKDSSADPRADGVPSPQETLTVGCRETRSPDTDRKTRHPGSSEMRSTGCSDVRTPIPLASEVLPKTSWIAHPRCERSIDDPARTSYRVCPVVPSTSSSATLVPFRDCSISLRPDDSAQVGKHLVEYRVRPTIGAGVFVRFRFEKASYLSKEQSRSAMTVRIRPARVDDREFVLAVRSPYTSLHAYDCAATDDRVRGDERRHGRGFAQRARAAFRSALLRSSGPTFRQRAAPRPTAVRRIGSGESFRLAMSSSSIAKSSSASGGSPVCRIMRRSLAVRRAPRTRARSAVSAVLV
jgi:hypothetical protein